MYTLTTYSLLHVHICTVLIFTYVTVLIVGLPSYHTCLLGVVKGSEHGLGSSSGSTVSFSNLLCEDTSSVVGCDSKTLLQVGEILKLFNLAL